MRGRALRRRYGRHDVPDPKVYLSFSEGRYRVIQNALPISADKLTEAEALRVADHFGLKVSDRMWDGDNGRWVSR